MRLKSDCKGVNTTGRNQVKEQRESWSKLNGLASSKKQKAGDDGKDSRCVWRALAAK